MLPLNPAGGPRPRRGPPTLTITLGWPEAGFLCLLLLALALRLWELGGRAMHYDEAIHLQAAWRLAEGHGFEHSPWMHGPFQIEFTALFLWLFEDTDFTARLGYALFGTALAGIPYLLRRHVGNAGALITGALLALSPTMLYFSRFGRNDIIMAVWAAALLALMWRYFEEGRTRYLYLAAAVLAFMFATKETAYFVTLVFGGLAFLLALPQLAPWLTRRVSLAGLKGPAGFFLLFLTLTLPQWCPLFSLFQEPLGLTLANREGVTRGIVGAPQWEAPFITFPLYHAAWWFHSLAALLGASLLVLLCRRCGLAGRQLLPYLAAPLASAAATLLLVLRPAGSGTGGLPPAADYAIAVVLVAAALFALAAFRMTWQRGALLVLVPAAAAALYSVLFTGVVDVGAALNWLLPEKIKVDTSANGIPLNFLAAGTLVALALCVSIYLGLRWLGGTWLGLAAVFYVVWTALYTTFFTNPAGVFSGGWQGMGYWIAQQDVARGDQPWYYYLVGLPLYELVPAAFGIAGAVYFLRRGEVLGLIMTAWALATLVAYTIASEKMPWLLVNIALPLVFVSGAFLGRLLERVRWRHALGRGYLWSLALWPLILAASVHLLLRFVDPDAAFGARQWALLAVTAMASLTAAFLVRTAPLGRAAALGGIGLAALLLGFSLWGAFRAAYTYDDSNVEMLVYAQGGDDLRESSEKLEEQVFQRDPEGDVVVDYDAWYPLQWYVRHLHIEGRLTFSCFKAEDDPGSTTDCQPVSDLPEDEKPSARILTRAHGDRDNAFLEEYQREGPLQNLLWFPESYRRPGEDRAAEGSFLGFRGLPGRVQLSNDFQYFKSALGSRDSWRDGLDYWLFRKLDQPWYDSQYYLYLP